MTLRKLVEDRNIMIDFLLEDSIFVHELVMEFLSQHGIKNEDATIVNHYFYEQRRKLREFKIGE